MNTIYSYIDVTKAYEVAILDNAPDGLVVRLRDMVDSGSMYSARIPKEDIPELAYVFLALANEIVSPKQKLLQ